MGHFESQGTTIKLTIFYYIEAGIKWRVLIEVWEEKQG
jgi:hypothetical protein